MRACTHHFAERCSHSSCHSPCASKAASRQSNFCAHEFEARETTGNVSEVDALQDFYSLEAARWASHGRIDRSGHAILSRRAERRRRRGKCAARDLRAASWRSRALLAARRTGGGSDADGRVGAVHRKKALSRPRTGALRLREPEAKFKGDNNVTCDVDVTVPVTVPYGRVQSTLRQTSIRRNPILHYH